MIRFKVKMSHVIGAKDFRILICQQIKKYI